MTQEKYFPDDDDQRAKAIDRAADLSKRPGVFAYAIHCPRERAVYVETYGANGSPFVRAHEAVIYNPHVRTED